MSKIITIDPITRLEGHGKITIVLDDKGDVERAFFQIPELRGFEAFCVGRPAEDMPQITSRICGVCPTAHHMAGTKALDSLFKVEPTPTARAIRELFYNLFMFEDHTIHFYYLGGPDFIVGPDAPAGKRNILGVIEKVGVDVAKQVITIRKRCRDIMAEIGGKTIHPVLGLPGGVAKRITEETRDTIKAFSTDAIEFAKFTLKAFDDIVLKNKDYVDLILSDTYYHNTYYMGMVDENNKVNFYDGKIRIVDPEGNPVELFAPDEYADIFAEHVEDWSYIKFPYLRKIGWKGFIDGVNSGIVRVAPLARLNAADGMATPLAQQVYERMYATVGGKPCHNTLAYHWARLIEILYAAEKINELANLEELVSPDTRNMNLQTPKEGVGIVEAPRGTLIHHYESDERGVLTGVNLMVATLFNSAPICMSVEKAAKKLIKGGNVNDGLLNMVEMAFRAYDPCFSCATHSIMGEMLLNISFQDRYGKKLGSMKRDSIGKETVSWK
ncbi:MAG: Ni/Fe hydrogenase subunit alpha [Candidatus Cloacimonetes bacterium]|nr:Ni/Fe hydrogenase subunit alpha [Candidatus Cloacimonadota bacterium]MBL7149352.1 Ni/Fe hydrogenase subunit alpha [Candidatus Cloacimonadota bacterium]